MKTKIKRPGLLLGGVAAVVGLGLLAAGGRKEVEDQNITVQGLTEALKSEHRGIRYKVYRDETAAQGQNVLVGVEMDEGLGYEIIDGFWGAVAPAQVAAKQFIENIGQGVG